MMGSFDTLVGLSVCALAHPLGIAYDPNMTQIGFDKLDKHGRRHKPQWQTNLGTAMCATPRQRTFVAENVKKARKYFAVYTRPRRMREHAENKGISSAFYNVCFIIENCAKHSIKSRG
jgi:hypothetical protein